MLTKLKDRLTESLGVFGAILYLIFSIIYFCFPLRALGFHFIVNVLLIGAMLYIPILGDLLRHVLWIWSLVVVIGGSFSLPFTIVYYLFFILYCCTELIPLLLGIFGDIMQWISEIPYRQKRNKSRSKAQTNVSQKPIGMKWYKYLTRFGLFADALFYCTYGVLYLTGMMFTFISDGEATAEQFYAFYGPGLQIATFGLALALIALAVLCIILRRKLVNYHPDALKFVTIVYALAAAIPFVFSLVTAVVTSQSLATGEISAFIFRLLMLYASVRYFKRRSHLFSDKASTAYCPKETPIKATTIAEPPSETIVPMPTSADVPSTRTYEQELVEAANKKERLAAMELRADLRNYIEMARNELRAYVDEAKEKYDPQRRAGDAKYMAFIKYTFASTAYERTSAAIDEISEKISAIKSPRDVKDTWYSIQIAIDRYALNVDHAYGKETLAQDLFLYFFSSTNEERRQIANEQRANPIYGDETISIVMDLCLRIEKFFDK